MTRDELLTVLLYLSPILFIQIGLAAYALNDLRQRIVLRGSKTLWAVLLLITTLAVPTGILVSGLYLVWGRRSEG